MERFVARIARFDPPDSSPVLSVELRSGRLRGRFELTERTAAALVQALATWSDPDDAGQCDHCGGRIGPDLGCRDCGHLNGIFGATVAHHAARVAARTED